jgi:excisionase family DNA binding protein
MIKRVTKSSVESLLTSWNSELKKQIEAELNDQAPFMTVQKVAKVMDVSESTIRRYIRRGDLVAIESDGPNTARATANV